MPSATIELTADKAADQLAAMTEHTKERHGQLTLIAGGDTPDKAILKLKQASIENVAELKKGDEVELRVSAKVAEVHFVDVFDKDGYSAGTERRHICVAESVQVVDDQEG